MTNIIRLYPQITIQAKSLMDVDVKKRRGMGEKITQDQWLAEKAYKHGITPRTLEAVIRGQRPFKGYEDLLSKLFGTHVWRITWKEIK